MTKLRIARGFAGRPGLLRLAAYVLLDPETESFSYEVANRAEVLARLASAIGDRRTDLERYADEIDRDPQLTRELARRMRWRFDQKRRQPLGHRFAWYVLARALKPETIVETGIHHGLGSLALLRALERNAEEGSDGVLISIDREADAGRVVGPEASRGRWLRMEGDTGELLGPALEGRTVALMFHDTDHTEENQRMEFEATLAHAAPLTVLLDGSGGWAPTLKRVCEERSGSYERIPVRSRDHVYPGLDLVVGVFSMPAR